MQTQLMEAVEQLDWFPVVVAGWRKGPGPRLFSPADKVRWLLELCHDERPKRNELAVPHQLAESDQSVTFHPGRFLQHIKENWKRGGKPGTLCTIDPGAKQKPLSNLHDFLMFWLDGRRPGIAEQAKDEVRNELGAGSRLQRTAWRQNKMGKETSHRPGACCEEDESQRGNQRQ